MLGLPQGRPNGRYGNGQGRLYVPTTNQTTKDAGIVWNAYLS